MDLPFIHIILLAVPAKVSVQATLGGAEIPQSRKFAYLGGNTMVAVQFGSSVLAASVRVEYSVDNGGNWATLIPDVAAIAALQTTFSDWSALPMNCRTGVLIRALAVGLLSTNFGFIQLIAT